MIQNETKLSSDKDIDKKRKQTKLTFKSPKNCRSNRTKKGNVRKK